MKRLLLSFFVAILCILSVQAQETFFDDFEGYLVGDFLAVSNPNWSTWTNNPGSAEDVQITDEDAFSGSQSIKFVASSANGGPADVILPFGGTYDSGKFDFAMKMKVASGGGAYFNFQAVNPPGTTWAVEFRFNSTGTIDVVSDATTVIVGNYTHDQWIDVAVNIDLDNNTWDFLIDGVSQGTWTNNNNSIASMDLFPFGPDNGVCSYFVDDVQYNYEPALSYTLDAAVYAIDLGPKNIAGNSIDVKGRIRNLGTETLTDFNISWTNGVDSGMDMVTGVNVPTFGFYDFVHSMPLTLQEGNNQLIVTVSDANGMVDEEPANDSKTLNIDGVVPAQHKKVYVEEATGTWCPWCPRGAVGMDFMTDNYGAFFVGAAVHGGDIMEDPDYANGLGALSYPSAKMDRTGAFFDPNAGTLENNFYNRIIVNPSASLEVGAEWDETTRELKVSVTATLLTNLVGDFSLNAAILEDGVTGTTLDYAQANAYAGGGNGPMGGYENLPATVPASMMVYDHVARAVLGGYDGITGAIPNPAVAGEVYTQTFVYTLPADYDYDNIEIVGMLIRPTGSMDNVNDASIDEAIANGYVDPFVGTNEVAANNVVEFSPNPFQDRGNIYVSIEEASPVTYTLRNAVGQVLRSQAFGELQGEWMFPVEAAGLANGIYFVEVRIGNEVVTKRVVVAK